MGSLRDTLFRSHAGTCDGAITKVDGGVAGRRRQFGVWILKQAGSRESGVRARVEPRETASLQLRERRSECTDQRFSQAGGPGVHSTRHQMFRRSAVVSTGRPCRAPSHLPLPTGVHWPEVLGCCDASPFGAAAAVAPNRRMTCGGTATRPHSSSAPSQQDAAKRHRLGFHPYCTVLCHPSRSHRKKSQQGNSTNSLPVLNNSRRPLFFHPTRGRAANPLYTNPEVLRTRPRSAASSDRKTGIETNPSPGRQGNAEKETPEQVLQAAVHSPSVAQQHGRPQKRQPPWCVTRCPAAPSRAPRAPSHCCFASG
jgi:hypothetical protein